MAKAIRRVPDKVLRSRKNRVTETLYVGNLAFNTTGENPSEVIEYSVGKGIVVEKVTIITCVNGISKYGFIQLS